MCVNSNAPLESCSKPLLVCRVQSDYIVPNAYVLHIDNSNKCSAFCTKTMDALEWVCVRIYGPMNEWLTSTLTHTVGNCIYGSIWISGMLNETSKYIRDAFIFAAFRLFNLVTHIFVSADAHIVHYTVHTATLKANTIYICANWNVLNHLKWNSAFLCF